MQTCLLASVATVVVTELKITGPRSNLCLRQNRTPMHNQKKKKNSLKCELEKRAPDIEKAGNQHADEI